MGADNRNRKLAGVLEVGLCHHPVAFYVAGTSITAAHCLTRNCKLPRTMTEVKIFFLFASATTFLSTVLILSLPTPCVAEKLAKAFAGFAISASLLSLFYTVLSLYRPSLFSMTLNRLLFYRLWIPIGVAAGSALVGIMRFDRSQVSEPTGPVDAFVKSGIVLKGLCFSAALSFLTIEVGKLGHDADMRTFFVQSGYPVWFMYAVMAAEILGSLGLFLEATIVPSASCLFLIMSGAVFTHWRNGDPLSDSTDALHLLILLACMDLLVLSTRSSRFVRSHPEQGIRDTI